MRRAARERGLATTIGGSVGTGTRDLLKSDDEMRELVSAVETRKCVMSVDAFLDDQAILNAFAIETKLLEMQSSYHSEIADAAAKRITQINSRI